MRLSRKRKQRAVQPLLAIFARPHFVGQLEHDRGAGRQDSPLGKAAGVTARAESNSAAVRHCATQLLGNPLGKILLDQLLGVVRVLGSTIARRSHERSFLKERKTKEKRT